MNDKSSALKIILIPLAISAVFFLAVVLLLYDYDHFHLRKHDFYDANKFSVQPSMRLQGMGIINNVDFDSVIIGTSMLETASATLASKLLDGTFVNMSVRASNLYERSFILDALFREKKIKNVIYSIEAQYTPTTKLDNPKDWELLYDENMFNDLYVLFDANYVTGVLKNILFPSFVPNLIAKKHARISTNPKAADLDFFATPIADWVDEGEKKSLYGGLSNWVKRLDIPESKRFLLQILPATVGKIAPEDIKCPEKFHIDAVKKYFDNNILRFVKNNPSTRFDIIFPTNYRALYVFKLKVCDGFDYATHKKAVRYLVEQAEKYENLFIYGFEDQAFVDDIRNFRDINHYHPKFNDYMLESIAKGEHILTIQNVDTYLEKSEKLALEFDIQALYDETQTLLQEHNHPSVMNENKSLNQ